MKKNEIVEAVVQKMRMTHDRSMSKTDVIALLDSLGSVCAQALGAGKEFPMPGIGKLSASERAARLGRNPRTGEEVEIKASTVVKFSATKSLKDFLN